MNVHNVSVGITGHQQIADNAAWPWVTQEIERVLKQHPRAAGVSSLAKGADQVFAEVVIRCEMSLIVIIPCRGYEATFDKMGLAKYKRMLNLAYKSQTLDYDEPSEDAFFAAGREIVKRSSLMIAVWDGKPAKGLGGTGDVVNYAISQGKDVIHINPSTRQVVIIGGAKT